MKWNTADIKPAIPAGSTKSLPALCKVSFLLEDEDEETTETQTYCVCEYYTYNNKWEPITEHLEADTMPMADYNINARDGFKVLEWTEIN